MIGKTISHYRILAKLGEGGMGVVYKAEDTKLKRTVALKFLTPQALGTEEEKTRFVHEAQAAAALNHSNICTVYEIDESEGPTTAGRQYFIAMEYIEGQSLREKVDSGPLKLDEAVVIAIQVSEGLQKAHDERVVHRDIKSANIMVTEEGKAKIMDFGLAKLAGQTKITKTGRTVGTIAYMSPEQAQGEEIDHRTDIWSLGVVLYEMVTGQLPFKGEYEQAVVYSIMNEDPEPMTGLRTGVPMELERITNKALAKSPDERYQHVDEIEADLNILRKELETPGKVQPLEVAVEEPRKKRFKRFSIPVGIVLFMVLGIFLLRPSLFEEVLVSEPKPIAVISFDNQTGDKAFDYLRVAIPNLLITSLEQSKYLRVTTWERMNDLLKQMGKENVEIIDKEIGFELCRLDGIEAIVLGSFVKAGNTFATDVKVLDVNTKEILKSASSRGEGVASILKNQIDDLSKAISKGVGISERKIELSQRPITEVTTTSMQAYDSFLKGRINYEKFYIPEAERYFKQAIILDSTLAMAYYYLAKIHNVAIYRQERDTYLKRARHFSDRVTKRERLYIESAYYSHEGNKAAALNTLKNLTRGYPQDKRAHHRLAVIYRAQKMFNEAVLECKTALDLDPEFTFAINLLAYTYADMKDYEKAIEYLQRYVRLVPGEANPYNSMGDIYAFYLGRLDEGIVNFNKALEINPSFLSGGKLSYAYALKEQYDQALQWLEYAITHTTFSNLELVWYIWKGVYFYWLGRFESALSELDRALNLSINLNNEVLQANIELTKGWFYYDREEFDQAQKKFKDWFKIYRKIAPEGKPYTMAYFEFSLGLIDVRKGNIDSVNSRLARITSLLEKIDRQNLVNRISYYHDYLQVEYLLLKDSLDEAIERYRQMPPFGIIPLHNPEYIARYHSPFLHDVGARVYLIKGALAQAISEYERLLHFNPPDNWRLINPRCHYLLAKLYEEKGQNKKATEQYETFLNIWKDADEDLAEIIDAKERLAKLKELAVK